MLLYMIYEGFLVFLLGLLAEREGRLHCVRTPNLGLPISS